MSEMVKSRTNLKIDYAKPKHRPFPTTGLLLLGFVTLSLLIYLKNMWQSDPYKTPRAMPLTEKPFLSSRMGTLFHPKNTLISPTNHWKNVRVQPGDTLGIIFQRLALSNKELLILLKTQDAQKTFQTMYPGEVLKFLINEANQLQKLIYATDETESTAFIRTGSEFKTEITKLKMITKLVHVKATIKESLYIDTVKAGLPSNLTLQLATIFGGIIDFARDIHQGDTINLLYRVSYSGNKKIKTGDIVAAEFMNRGKIYKAVEYTDPAGNTNYYSTDGLSLRREFMRAPVSYTHISSHFTDRRWHPILHRFRSHHGVDYAADYGTPIRATGDGHIIHKGKKGGYGNTIIIKHGMKYSTLYAHMSSYAKNIRWGSLVKQGQIIGYVGSSGLATGPHLHYEFRVFGKHNNPLKVKLPQASPIRTTYRSDFKLHTEKILAQLEQSDHQLLASLTSHS